MRAIRAAGWILLSLVAGCFTPPALLVPERVDVAATLAVLPAEVERVALEVRPGIFLRGVFLPSDPGAPVVLHLAESSGSVVGRRPGYEHLFTQLADLGFASLMLDYRGIGESGGERSVKHLTEDALAMWDEALRRAGGDPARVVLRGISIGTVACAELVQHGVRPGGWIAIVPVRPQTATRRFARTFRGRMAGWFAAFAFRDISRLRMEDVLARAPVPPLVVTGDEEFLVDEKERAALRAAVAEAGGTFRLKSGDHVVLSIEGHTLSSDELEYLLPMVQDSVPIDERFARLLERLPTSVHARFASGEPRERLRGIARYVLVSDAKVAAAAALGVEDSQRAALWNWRMGEMRYSNELDFETLAAAASLADPAGELPLELLFEQDRVKRVSRLGGVIVFGWDPATLEVCADAVEAGQRGMYSSTSLSIGAYEGTLRHEPAQLWAQLTRRGLNLTDRRRQFLRLLLKIGRYPDRLRRDDRGRLVLEVLRGGSWKSLELTPVAERGAFGDHALPGE